MTAPATILCVSVDHTTSDRNVRLRVKMGEKAQQWADSMMRHVRALDGVSEAFVLSTCNRVEVYAAIDAGTDAEPVVELITTSLRELAWHRESKWQGKILNLIPDEAIMDKIGLVGDERPKQRTHAEAMAEGALMVHALNQGIIVREGDEASDHLIDVAMGLKSAHVGDTKITEQMRAAFKRATRAGHCRSGGALDKLVRAALKEAAPLRSKYSAFERCNGLGATAGFLASMSTDEMVQSTNYMPDVLIIGSGDEALAAAKSITFGDCEVVICSDDIEKSAEIARAARRAHPGREHRIHLHTIRPEAAVDWALFDIIICTDPVEGARLSADNIARMNRNRWAWYTRQGKSDQMTSLTVIDLTDGIGIDPDVEHLEGIFWSDTAQLEFHFGNSMSRAAAGIEAAGRASEAAKDKYRAWQVNQMIAGRIKDECAKIDRWASTAAKRLERDAALTETELEAARREVHAQAAQQKHERVGRIRAHAGLTVASRTISPRELAAA